MAIPYGEAPPAARILLPRASVMTGLIEMDERPFVVVFEESKKKMNYVATLF